MNGARIILTLNPAAVGNVIVNHEEFNQTQSHLSIEDILYHIKQEQLSTQWQSMSQESQEKIPY